MLKKIYKKLFPDWSKLLKKEAIGCESVLDLACGYNSLIKEINISYKVGVEMFSDYLNKSKKRNIHNKYIQGDILKLQFPPKSYDLVFCSEVIEHLEKKEGYDLLNKAEMWAGKKVIITTPNGFLNQEEYDNNPLQVHKSGWSVDEFKKRGYVVHGMGGLRMLKKEEGRLRWGPNWFWRIISDITQKIVYFFPAVAFQLFAVKEINDE